MKAVKFLFIALAAMGLVACGEDKGAGSAGNVDTSTPDGAFNAVIASVRSNDLKTLIQTSMSEQKYNELVAEFDANKGGFSESDNMQFQQMMGMLQAEGAVDTLYGMVAPQLEQAKAMVPMMAMMGKDQALMSIDTNPMIPADQKDSAKEVTGALIDWATSADLFSEDVTKKAISAAVDMANDLDMKSLDELKTMNFDQALDKAGIVLGGVKNVMGAYGVSIDDMLDSVELSNVQVNGDKATMDLTMTLFGKELKQAVNMVQKDGKWVGEQ